MLITVPSLLLVHSCPGARSTRIGICQVLMSSLLIHPTGGRVETHFHISVSLALLAFYADWAVIAAASGVTALDHLLRGIYWPMSVSAQPRSRTFAGSNTRSGCASAMPFLSVPDTNAAKLFRLARNMTFKLAGLPGLPRRIHRPAQSPGQRSPYRHGRRSRAQS